MTSHLPFRYVTNTQKLCSLYKQFVRDAECWHLNRLNYRFKAVKIRARFDEYMKIKDPEKLSKLVHDLEEEIFHTRHWQPKIYANGVRGSAYGREIQLPDSLLDYWHPLEKAQYPEYFATREKRKEEFIRMWDKEFSKST